jgi:hypothetical protein
LFYVRFRPIADISVHCFYGAMLLLLSAVAFECQTVSGTYAIYANHDLLHVDGSRHFVEVTSDKLDAGLERRGWENTVARGRFTICGVGVGKPKRLSPQDRVQLRSSTGVRFERRVP